MTNTHAATLLDWRSELARARTHRNHGNEEFLTAVARIAESVPQTEIACSSRPPRDGQVFTF